MNNETLELKNSHYKLDARLDKVETKVDMFIQRSDERWEQLTREMDKNHSAFKDSLNTNFKMYVVLITLTFSLIGWFLSVLLKTTTIAV